MIMTRAFFYMAALLAAMSFGVDPAGAQYSAFDDPPSVGGNAAAGSSEFGPTQSEIQGGDFAQGQSAQVIVLLRNSSSAPIILQKIDLVPSSNVSASITGNQCSGDAVKPGLECAVTVAIKGEAGGKYRVGMLINHSGRTKISNAAIVGNVTAGGAGSADGMPSNEIDAFPSEVKFDKTKGRTPLVRSITLRNNSTKAIEVSDIELIASPLTGFSVSAPSCVKLEASQSCIATITWAPSVEGKAEGVIVLRHNGPSGSLQIALSGEFERTATTTAERFPTAVPGEGLIVSDRDTIEFGTDIDGAASISVTLINSGDKDVLMRQVKLAGSDNGLSLSNDDCRSGKVLKTNQGCVLTVNWLPRRKGPVIDDVQIMHDGARGVLVLPVRGTAKKAVNLNMPMAGSGSSGGIPRLPGGELDETLVGAADSADGAGTGQRGFESGMGGGITLATDMASLNGYRITSLSGVSAVVTGPRGRVVVKDGAPAPIAGAYWIPRITPEGVELIGQAESVFLLFDRSLGIISAAASGAAGAAGTTTTTQPATAEDSGNGE